MKTALRLILLILLVAAGAMLALYLLQERLIFDRKAIPAERLARLRADRPRVEELSVPTPDGVRLHGWLVRGAVPVPVGAAGAVGAAGVGTPAAPPGGSTGGGQAPSARAPLVVYFGGNGEEVSWMADQAHRMGSWSLLLVSYRGYGLSEGRPGEASLLRDALTVYDSITRRDDVDPGRIVVMGRSIGSGVAVHLARERRVEAAILVSPYDSLAAVVRDAFPFLPVGLLLRNRFEASSWAAGVRVPMLALIAAEDRVIAPAHSRRLAAAWAGPREVRLIAGAGHNSIDRSPAYWDSIRGFLARL